MWRSFAVLALASALSACIADDSPLPSSEGAIDTGAFPTFREAPRAAAPQLGEAEALHEIRRLARAGDEAFIRAGMPMADVEALRAASDRSFDEAGGIPFTDQEMLELARQAAVRRAMAGMSEVERLRFLRRVHEERTLERIRASGAAREAEPGAPAAPPPAPATAPTTGSGAATL